MTDFREMFRRVGFGLESMEIGRALRSQRREEFRRETRAEHYSRHRNLQDNPDESLEDSSPETETAEEQLAKARKNRLERLHRWRKEKEIRKKIEKMQAKPIFKVGVMHHKAFSPPSLLSPVADTKLCKTKSTSDIPEKRVTRATQKRLAAKAIKNAIVKRANLKKLKKEKPQEEQASSGESFAPKDYQFKAPKGIKAIPLFGVLALNPDKVASSNSGIVSFFDRKKTSENKDENERSIKINTPRSVKKRFARTPSSVKKSSPIKEAEVFGIHPFSRITRQKTTLHKEEKEKNVKNVKNTNSEESQLSKTPIDRFRRKHNIKTIDSEIDKAKSLKFEDVLKTSQTHKNISVNDAEQRAYLNESNGSIDFGEQKLILNEIENIPNEEQIKKPAEQLKYRTRSKAIDVKKIDTPENPNRVNIRKSKRNAKLLNEIKEDEQKSKANTDKLMTFDMQKEIENNTSYIGEAKSTDLSEGNDVSGKIGKKNTIRKRKHSLTSEELKEKFISKKSTATTTSEAPQKRSRLRKNYCTSTQNISSPITSKKDGNVQTKYKTNTKEKLTDRLKKAVQKIETELNVDKSGEESDQASYIKSKMLNKAKVTIRQRAQANDDLLKEESFLDSNSNEDILSDICGKQKEDISLQFSINSPKKRVEEQEAKSDVMDEDVLPESVNNEKPDIISDETISPDRFKKSTEEINLQKSNSTPVFLEKKTRSRKNNRSLSSPEKNSPLHGMKSNINADSILNNSEVNIRKTRRSDTKNAIPKTPEVELPMIQKTSAKKAEKIINIDKTVKTACAAENLTDAPNTEKIVSSPQKQSRLQKFKQFITTMEKYSTMDETDKESDTNAETIPNKYQIRTRRVRRSDVTNTVPDISQDESKSSQRNAIKKIEPSEIDEIEKASENVMNAQDNLEEKSANEEIINNDILVSSENKITESNTRRTRRSNQTNTNTQEITENNLIELDTYNIPEVQDNNESTVSSRRSNSRKSLSSPDKILTKSETIKDNIAEVLPDNRLHPCNAKPSLNSSKVSNNHEVQEYESVISDKRALRKRKQSLNATASSQDQIVLEADAKMESELDKPKTPTLKFDVNIVQSESSKAQESPACRKGVLKKKEDTYFIDETEHKVNGENNSSISFDEEKKEMSFFEQRLSKTPEMLDKPPAFFSPYIVTSRGKRSMRKEQKVRLGIDTSLSEDAIPTKDTVMQKLNISIEEEERTAQYFKYLLNKEIDRLMELCLKWNKIKEEPDISEDAKYKINAAVGQTMLLINKKFERFNRLVHDCETGKGEMLVTCKDLQGFWDMMYMEITNCDDRMKQLEEDKARGWVEEEIVVAPPKKKLPKKAPKKPTVNKPSSIRAHILAARKKKIESNENNKGLEVDIIDAQHKSQVVFEQIPKRQSLKISPKNSPKPVTRRSPSAPKSDKKRRSLLEMVQFSEASKNITSPLTMMKVSQMCKTPPEVHLDESIIYINSDQTPAKSILKRAEECHPNESLSEKSISKVNFQERSKKTLQYEEDGVDKYASNPLSQVERLNESKSLNTSNLNESVTERNLQLLTPLQSLENKVEKSKVEQGNNEIEDIPNPKNQKITPKRSKNLRNSSATFTAPLTPRATKKVSKTSAPEEIEKVENKDQVFNKNINSEVNKDQNEVTPKAKRTSRKSVKFTAENSIPNSSIRRSARLTIFEGIGSESLSLNENSNSSRQSVRYTGNNLTPKTTSRHSNRLTVFGSTETESASPLPNGDLISFNTPN